MRATALPVLKFSLKLVKWLLLAALSVVVLTLASWWLLPDEELDSGVKAMMAVQHAPPPLENAYFAVWGLRASPGMDPHQTGRQMVADHERRVAADGPRLIFDPLPFLGAAQLKEPAFKACQVYEEGCLDSYRTRRNEVHRAIADNALLLTRYRSLRNYPRYSQKDVTWTVGSPLPEASLAMLSRLVDAEVSLQLELPKHRPAALRELAADVRFWRQVLVESDTLIAQLVAAAVLNRKYVLASEIMRAYPDAARLETAALADITRPLTTDKVNLLRALDAEFRQIAPTLMVADAWSDENVGSPILNGILGLGFKPNATVNAYYRSLLAQRELHARSPGEIRAVRAAGAPQTVRDLWRPATVFYNPMGKILLAMSYDLLDPYAFRLHDLAGVSRMVELQRRLLVERVAVERRADFISVQPPALRDPYTERPFELVGDTIRFQGHGGRGPANGILAVQL